MQVIGLFSVLRSQIWLLQGNLKEMQPKNMKIHNKLSDENEFYDFLALCQNKPLAQKRVWSQCLNHLI